MRVLVTGASRGIGRAVALRFAAEHGSGLTIGLLARSHSKPIHPELDGCLIETCKAIESHGAAAIPIGVDMRDPACLKHGLRNFLNAAGGLDVLINNASALVTQEKQMDLAYEVNTRGTMICLNECHAALEESGGSIVSMAPPIRLGRLEWLTRYGIAYTLSKYNMTLATLAKASRRVRANCLWPRHMVSTAATARLEGAHPGAFEGAFTRGRQVEHVAEAVHTLATRPDWNARTLFDDEVCDMPLTHAPLDAFVERDARPQWPATP